MSLSIVYNTEKSDWRSDTYYASGWPSEKGGKNFVVPFLSFGISAQSEYKDSAWEFIKFVLRQDLRDYDIYGNLMPTGKSAQESSMKEYTDMYNSVPTMGYSDESEEKYCNLCVKRPETGLQIREHICSIAFHQP